VVLLLTSAFISASEIAFFSLSSVDLSDIKEKRHPSDSSIKQLLKRSESLRVSLHIVNSIVNVTFVLLSAYAASDVIRVHQAPWLLFAGILFILLFFLLLFGEFIPSTYVKRDPLKFCRKVVKLVNSIETTCRPLSKLLLNSSSTVNRALLKKRHELSVDELSKALEMTSTDVPEEKEMLEEIIKFYNKTASEIMTSRLDVEDIEIQTGFRDVIGFIIESGYSRIPVFADTEDNIKGVLYIKDLLPYIDKPDTFRWQSLIRPAYFVPETKKIDDLLEEFRTNKIHMAIVVDEFGGTSGIVTMEDILEEIVGDISDEYDEDERQFIRLADGSLIFEAKIPLNDFFRVIDEEPSEFDKYTEEVETLAGLLLELKGDFPKRQEIIPFNGYNFQILELDNRRIQKVKFTRVSRPEKNTH
jgi:gliding motility-associated protein GldE